MLHKNLKPFSEHFLWGASTSAYQVEEAALEDGKGPSCQDVKEIPAGTADLSVSDGMKNFGKTLGKVFG